MLFGDADFASDAYYGNQWNSNLFLNAVNWLAAEELLIGNRQSARQERPIVISNRFIKRLIVLVAAPPALIALIGLAVWWRRRKL